MPKKNEKPKKESGWVEYLNGGPSHFVDELHPQTMLTLCSVLVSSRFYKTSMSKDKCKQCQAIVRMRTRKRKRARQFS